jgi:methionyl aminopeptidase
MSIGSTSDLEGLRRTGRVVAETLAAMRAAVRIGMTTAELDRVAAETFARAGARSAPKVTYGFPGTTCISVNDEIVHGIPGPRRLRAGDVVKIDVTAELGGYVADAATTILLPPVEAAVRALQQSARAALREGLAVARAGQLVSAIGRAISARAARDRCFVVRELCGHGVGRAIHEPPEVPNYEDTTRQERLTDGLVIAVEPMFAAARSRAMASVDGWTIRTSTGAIAVHEEHTVVVTDGVPEILTAA